MGIKRPIYKMVSDVTRTSHSHGESRCFCGNDKSSKYRLFGSLGNAGSVISDDDDSVKDTMSVLIQKLLIENRNLKDENKLLRASHSPGVFKESFLESVRFPVQRSYAQVVADNRHYAETGFERKCEKRIKKKNLKACQFCGGIHRWGKDRCPAFGNKCKVCLKMNHLDDVCFYSKFSKLRKARSLPVSLDQRKNSENVSDDDTAAAVDKTEDVNEDTESADLTCKSEDEVKATDVLERRMNVGATVVDVSQDCMVKKDKVLEWKDVME